MEKLIYYSGMLLGRLDADYVNYIGQLGCSSDVAACADMELSRSFSSGVWRESLPDPWTHLQSICP
jgi:hypothetical protein